MFVGLPACMDKDRNTELEVKFSISVFLLHAGRPTSISLMIIDNEIKACNCMHVCDCCIIWNCCVTRVSEHLQSIACMLRHVMHIQDNVQWS